jgi:hypothetical protein
MRIKQWMFADLNKCFEAVSSQHDMRLAKELLGEFFGGWSIESLAGQAKVGDRLCMIVGSDVFAYPCDDLVRHRE